MLALTRLALVLVMLALGTASCRGGEPDTGDAATPLARSATSPSASSPPPPAPGGGAPSSPRPSPATSASPPSSGSPTATPTAQSRPQGFRATTLAIPALAIDAPIQASRVVPADSYPPTPGCPPSTPGETTLTVPDHGFATPEDALDGLENKAWIFGHSRWQNQPGLFLRLQDLNLGDELLLDGFDRTTGARFEDRRFVVNGIYLADIESGTKLVESAGGDGPPRPMVILQTSVREDGANKQWLLSQQKVLAKSRNIVAGDLADPCKYLLLFVLAS